MLLNYIDWNVRPQIFDLGSFQLRWYSLLFGLGFVLSYYFLSKMFKKEKIAPELLDKLAFYIIIATILGARFGHCLFYEPEVYLKAPWKIILPFDFGNNGSFRFTGYQGLASHGGVIGVLIGLYLFARKYKKPYLWVVDRIAIVGPLAGACIRFGNLFNSEIYGVQTDLPWGFRFLREAKYYGISPEEVVPKHPTQLYEAFAYLAIFALLLFLYKRGKALKQGMYLGIFFIFTFTARFLIEFVKETQVDFEEGMSLNMGQWLSLPLIALGIYLVLRKAPLDKATPQKKPAK